MVSLITVAIVLSVLWLLGFISSNTFGGLIHLVLVVAVVLIILEVLKKK